MDHTPFDYNDCDHVIPDQQLTRIGKLTVAWAGYDSMVTYYLLHSFGMPLDTGSMIVGNMSTEAKLKKLIDLHQHYGWSEVADMIKLMLVDHQRAVLIRNAVMHSRLIGVQKSDRDTLCYVAFKQIQQQVGALKCNLVHKEGMRLATVFALNAANAMSDAIENFDTPLQPKSAS